MAHGYTEYVYATPFGHITIASDGCAITNVALGKMTFGHTALPTAQTNLAAEEILEYMSGKRSVFDVPMRIEGSKFQQDILQAICEIPYSQTRTSREIAAASGHEGAQRQVGSVARNNPIAVLIPTHRLVSTSGYYDKNDRLANLNAALRNLERRFA